MAPNKIHPIGDTTKNKYIKTLKKGGEQPDKTPVDESLIKENMRLVHEFLKHSVCAQYALKNHDATTDPDDLLQEALIGLVIAIQRHKRGPFDEFARSWMKCKIYKAMSLRGTIQTPASVQYLCYRTEEAIELLMQKKGYTGSIPTVDQVYMEMKRTNKELTNNERNIVQNIVLTIATRSKNPANHVTE